MKPEYLTASRDVARKSMVLLKNDQHVLPLSKTTRSFAVIGPLADAKKEMIGSWSAAGEGAKAVSILEGIKAAVTPSTKIVFAKGCNINDDTTKGFAQALQAAKQADIVVMALGEAALMTGEAASRASLNLPGVQQQLLEAIYKTGKPIVVVLLNGRPLTINWMTQNKVAVLEAWFPGTEAGHAVADVLFGDYNPSGKLPVTFPRSVGQIPIFYNMKNTGRPMDPNNKYSSKYLDESNAPLFPFGYGLSYTTFEYGDVQLNKQEITQQEGITITCKVKNTGKREGEEVVQLYVHDLVGSVTRPVKELKGFKKVMLQPGESKEISFTLTQSDLSFYRRDMSFGTEPGKYDVFVGGNSDDLKKASFTLK